jgi:hypothetical protein
VKDAGMRKLAVILVGFAVLAAPPEARADPAAYSGAPIRGQVMDDATGKPLEGAIVVAQWELVREVIPGLVNESYGDVLNIAEAVTDRDGRYEIPGWGPIARPMFFHLEERDGGPRQMRRFPFISLLASTAQQAPQ